MTRGVRINILGASGAGVSTTGRGLAARLAVPYYDADDYFHEPTDPPFQRPRSPARRREMMAADLSPAANWVLGGGIVGWESVPELNVSAFVFLSAGLPTRMDRLRRRESERFGARILPGGDMERTHQEFLEWASHYDAGDREGKSRLGHEAFLAAQSVPVLRLDGELRTATLVERIIRFLDDPA